MKYGLLLGVIFNALFLNAQLHKKQIIALPVISNSNILKNSWTGGMNAPIFSEVDLDNDGRMDLFAFDKSADKVMTFLNNGSQTDMPYEYAPQYEKMFPDSMHGWAVIRDYNKDGVPDLFTLFRNQGISYYKGYRNAGKLSFSLIKDEIYYSDSNTISDHIYTFYDDLPAFVDVNNDGYMDILSFSIFGGQNVYYYENTTPSYANQDTLHFYEVTQCWGGFLENSNTNSLLLDFCTSNGIHSPPPSGLPRHQGGSLFAFDYDNDKDIDIAMGDVSYNHLVYAENGGQPRNSHMTYIDSTFPKYDVPVDLAVFPSAYAIDVNNDGNKDLLVSTFWGGPQQGQARDVKNVWYYKNQNLPNFNKYTYQTDDFLTNTQLDAGSDSKVFFYDFNEDSLLDIVVSNYGYYQPLTTSISKLQLLQNIGTITNPQFSVITEDWCGLSKYGFLAMHPAFGDLDGDGKNDMMLGESTGKIHYFKNNGSSNPFQAMTTPNYAGIDVGDNSAPTLYDVNGDSLLDLIVGRRDGKFSYYKNLGTKTVPSFLKDSVNSFFGNAKVNDATGAIYTGYSSPLVQKENGKLYLYSGSFRGIIYKFEINTDSLYKGTFAVIDTNAFQLKPGFKANVALGDLNNDGKGEYLFGNARGGLMLFTDSIWKEVSSLETVENEYGFVKLFPNPAQNNLHCELMGELVEVQAVEVFDLLGTKHSVNFKKENEHQLVFDIADLSAGVYLLHIRTTNQWLNKKFIVVK